MERKKRNIKKVVKRRIDFKLMSNSKNIRKKQETKMGVRDKLRRGGTPPKHIPVDLVGRNAIRRGVIFLPESQEYLPVSESKEPISIIVTAYQTQDYIEECLDSIENQTYFVNNDDYEVLVGVDGCQETLNKLLEIRHKYRNLRILMMESNKGTYITSNTLLDMVKNEHIIRFDSDDIMKPEMINEIIAISDKFNVIRFRYDKFIKGDIIEYNSIYHAHGAIYCHRLIYDKLGGYQPWKCAADTDLLKRVKMGFREGLIKEHLIKYRWHGNSLTKKIDGTQRAKYHKMMRENNKLKVNRVVNQYTEKI